VRAADQLDEARADEPGITGPDTVAPLGEPREGAPGELGLEREVVVHPHEARGPARRPGTHGRALEDEHLGAARCEVERERGTLHTGADDHDVRGPDRQPAQRPTTARRRGARPFLRRDIARRASWLMVVASMLALRRGSDRTVTLRSSAGCPAIGHSTDGVIRDGRTLRQ
jgi:hypothetical protein